LKEEAFHDVVGKYLFTEKKPLRNDVVGMLQKKPKLLERHTIVERVTEKVLSFVEKYISGISSV
jgi:type I restriction enzyme R subunit